MLKIKNLKKYFGGVKAVDGCDFEVKERTITALIGPNGAGKSTVFNLISGILKTETGEINFDGENITNSRPEKISNLGISRLFQQSSLFNNLKVKENLLLALDNEDTKFWKNLLGLNPVRGYGNNKKSQTLSKIKEFLTRQSPQSSNGVNKIGESKEKKIKEMLKLVGLDKFEDKLAKDLSYGQKRLVELLRTILNPHKFLMLDEPVAGVNPKLREEISEILLDLKKKGETVLLIEHDMNFTLNVADEVIVMEKGKVIATGRPEEIRNNSKVLEAYLGE